jgi:hypothetical protein
MEAEADMVVGIHEGERTETVEDASANLRIF